MSRPLSALFLDMDSFFASVEQHRDPSLRGRPVGVVPVMADSSCCIAASYEAKAFGVKTGTNIREAREKCPGICFVLAQHEHYVEWHHKIVEVVESCIHVERVMSIDEMVCMLPFNWRDPDFVRLLGVQIKEKMAEMSPVIRCSIGVAPNGWLAKMASKVNKPDGLTVWEDEKDLPEALFQMDLSDIHGVGKNMEARLRAGGVQTVKEMYAVPRERLKAIWGGIEGERMWFRLRGKHLSAEDTVKRTVGHSHVLPPEERVPEKAHAVLHRLVQKAAMRMRNYGMLAGAMELQIRGVSGERWNPWMGFTETADSLFFSKMTTALWKQISFEEQKVLRVGVVLFKLKERDNYTPSLFSKRDEKREKLNESMDQVVNKFGKGALYLGGAHGAVRSAPMRIAFTHIPDVKLESNLEDEERMTRDSAEGLEGGV